MSKKLITSALTLALGVLGVSGCCGGQKVGDTCEKGEAACLDEKNALACEDGKFIATPCKGTKGCVADQTIVTCDISGNAAGDVCSKDDDGNADCTADGKSQITCKAGKYVVEPCRGPDTCKIEGDLAVCDQSIAQPGDSCDNVRGGSYACSVDNKSVLVCKGGKFAEDSKCPGPKGCGFLNKDITCDDGK